MWWWIGVALAGPVWSEMPAPQVSRAPSTVEIDGDLADWAGFPFQAFGAAPDLHGRFGVGQDDEALYVVAEIHDDVWVAPGDEARLSERVRGDHLEVWLFDPSVRRGEGCTEVWKGLCVGELIDAETFAAGVATRHLGVFRTGGLHLPDERGPIDGQRADAVWADGPDGSVRIELRIPRGDLPWMDDMEIRSLGVVVDVFDADKPSGGQESVWSTSPRHGWWTLSGNERPLALAWTRDPDLAPIWAALRPVAPPSRRPDQLCRPDRRGWDCRSRIYRRSGPLETVADVHLINETGDDRRSWVSVGESAVELKGDVIWRGDLEGRRCVSTWWDEPSGCFGAGCGDSHHSVWLACEVGAGAAQAQLPLVIRSGLGSGEVEGEVCVAPSEAWPRGSAGNTWPGEVYVEPALVRFDGPGAAITLEQPCESGGDQQTSRQTVRVSVEDGRLVVRGP